MTAASRAGTVAPMSSTRALRESPPPYSAFPSNTDSCRLHSGSADKFSTLQWCGIDTHSVDTVLHTLSFDFSPLLAIGRTIFSCDAEQRQQDDFAQLQADVSVLSTCKVGEAELWFSVA